MVQEPLFENPFVRSNPGFDPRSIGDILRSGSGPSFDAVRLQLNAWFSRWRSSMDDLTTKEREHEIGRVRRMLSEGDDESLRQNYWELLVHEILWRLGYRMRTHSREHFVGSQRTKADFEAIRGAEVCLVECVCPASLGGKEKEFESLQERLLEVCIGITFSSPYLIVLTIEPRFPLPLRWGEKEIPAFESPRAWLRELEIDPSSAARVLTEQLEAWLAGAPAPDPAGCEGIAEWFQYISRLTSSNPDELDDLWPEVQRWATIASASRLGMPIPEQMFVQYLDRHTPGSLQSESFRANLVRQSMTPPLSVCPFKDLGGLSGWRIQAHAMPLPEESNMGIPESGVYQVIPRGPRYENTDERLAKKLNEKAHKYGLPKHPFVVAVAGDVPASTLAGGRWTSRNQSAEGRSIDADGTGAFRRCSHLSGVLCAPADPLWLGQSSMDLCMRSSSTSRIARLGGYDQVTPTHLRERPGLSLRDALRLPRDWPYHGTEAFDPKEDDLLTVAADASGRGDWTTVGAASWHLLMRTGCDQDDMRWAALYGLALVAIVREGAGAAEREHAIELIRLSRSRGSKQGAGLGHLCLAHVAMEGGQRGLAARRLSCARRCWAKGIPSEAAEAFERVRVAVEDATWSTAPVFDLNQHPSTLREVKADRAGNREPREEAEDIAENLQILPVRTAASWGSALAQKVCQEWAEPLQSRWSAEIPRLSAALACTQRLTASPPIQEDLRAAQADFEWLRGLQREVRQNGAQNDKALSQIIAVYHATGAALCAAGVDRPGWIGGGVARVVATWLVVRDFLSEAQRREAVDILSELVKRLGPTRTGPTSATPGRLF